MDIDRALRRIFSIALVTVAGLGCATGDDAESVSPLPTVPGGTEVYTPTGPASTLEKVVDPGYHMANARRAFEADRPNGASDELEKLAAFLRYEEAAAVGDRKSALEASRAEIEDLADAVGRGEVDSFRIVEHAFARARAALRR